MRESITARETEKDPTDSDYNTVMGVSVHPCWSGHSGTKILYERRSGRVEGKYRESITLVHEFVTREIQKIEEQYRNNVRRLLEFGQRMGTPSVIWRH